MSRSISILSALLIIFNCFSFAQYRTFHGRFAVGFSTITVTASSGRPMLVSLWYPARQKCHQPMTVATYLSSNTIMGTDQVNGFTKNIQRLYDLQDTIPVSSLSGILGLVTKACYGVERAKGKFPLIIAQSNPASYCDIFESFAGNGFVVAGVTWDYTKDQEPASDSFLYTIQVDFVNDLLDYMLQQSYIDTTDITAFGHGGGIQPAVYIGMRSKRIQKIINLDGGLFDPRSKTDCNVLYFPDNLHASLLHIITKSLSPQEDSLQFYRLKNPITRITFLSPDIQHHDFTALGKAAYTLNLRKNTSIIDKANQLAMETMLSFLQHKRVRTIDNSLMKIERFNTR